MLEHEPSPPLASARKSGGRARVSTRAAIVPEMPKLPLGTPSVAPKENATLTLEEKLAAYERAVLGLVQLTGCSATYMNVEHMSYTLSGT